MSKAWMHIDEDSGYTTVVYAETRGKAQRMVANEEGIPFIEARVSRLQWADEYGSFDKIPTEVLFDEGWWFECSCCYKQITENDDFFKTPDGYYACKDCYEKMKWSEKNG